MKHAGPLTQGVYQEQFENVFSEYHRGRFAFATSSGAAALGITSLERHITLDRAMYGSDQAASVEPNGLHQLIGAVRKIEKAMGNGNMTINSKEITTAKKLRAHIPFESHQ